MTGKIDDWSDTVTTVDSTPATKADLYDLEKRMKEVTKADLNAFAKQMSEVTKADLDAFAKQMSAATKADLDALELRFEQKLAKHPTKQDLTSAFNAFLDQVRIFIGALDDKHTHRTDRLRHDLDAHRADATVHRAPRARKTGSR